MNIRTFEKQTNRDKLLYGIIDLSELFQVTPRTIYNWKEQGRFSFVQINSKTYVTAAQLAEFLNQNEVKSLKSRNY